MNNIPQSFEDFYALLFHQPLWQNHEMIPITSVIRRELQTNYSSFEKLFSLQQGVLKEYHQLGRYVEMLWKIYLENSSCFELLGHNIQINRKGKTQGEIDFILFHKLSGKTIHLEISIKFYLSIYVNNRRFCVGSNSRDRLDKKIRHLKQKQLPLLISHPLPNVQIDIRAGIISGYIFEQSSYIMGYKWIYENQLPHQDLFSQLKKMDWISGRTSLPFSRIDSLEQPELFIHQSTGSKIFIAPKGWTKSIIL